MGKIIVLPDSVSSKIAAGEVIERPASIIRELIDNSIDAGATEITVKIEEAGIKRIIVSDNGSGIDKEDFVLVFTKHATSKIREMDDLQSLYTMGFRGEALHSIETVSKITLVSNTDPAGKKTGFKVSNFGESAFKLLPVAAKKGTRVDVEDIFYNIPARRKFLKSKVTEYNAVKKVVSDKAFAFLDVRFDFYSDGKQVFSTTGEDDFSKVFFAINRNENAFDVYEDALPAGKNLKIKLIHSGADVFFQNRKHQSLYVNSRPVTVSFFYPALDTGYRNFVSPGRYPLFFVYIDIDPSLIDVNIHPAKKEIKFINQNEIFSAIQNAVSQSFGKNFRREISESDGFSFGADKPITGENDISFNELQFNGLQSNGLVNGIGEKTGISESRSIYKLTEQRSIPDENGEYKILGVVFDTYIVVEKNDRVLLIDQHAAAEAIIFRKKKEKHETRNVEKLLIPAVIELDRWDNNIEKKIAILNKNKFRIEMNEGSSITVREIPEVLLLKKDYGIACEIITDFLENKEDLKADIVDHILIESSCKEAIKKGDRISLLEMAEIIHEYFKYGITNCPHGRPSHFELTKDGLEKIFQRKK
jgi:DNA mismatch repair protein MutL